MSEVINAASKFSGDNIEWKKEKEKEAAWRETQQSKNC